jgi:hypothetical protein
MAFIVIEAATETVPVALAHVGVEPSVVLWMTASVVAELRVTV